MPIEIDMNVQVNSAISNEIRSKLKILERTASIHIRLMAKIITEKKFRFEIPEGKEKRTD